MRLASFSSALGNFLSAMLLLLLLVVWQISSNGVVRGGGEDDGSGIGGTGRTGSSGGESGFGGTGLKPYLGINSALENQIEVQILREPALRATAITETHVAQTQVAVVTPATPRTGIVQSEPMPASIVSSAPISIAESVQSTLDSSALYYEQLNDVLGKAEWTGSSEIDTPTSPTTESSTNWSAVVEFLSRNLPTKSSETPESESNQLARAEMPDAAVDLARPEPLQRPQLPPVQRVSPLQRAAILPPRVQPMRL